MAEMNIIGRITGFSIEPNKEGETPVLMLQIELTEPTDMQSVELMRHAGMDYNPPTDSTTVVLPITESLKIAIANDDGVAPESLPGECEMYSVASFAGPKLSKIKCDVVGNLTADSGPAGEVNINAGTFGAARAEDLVTATPDTDPAFFAWLEAVGAATGVTPAPKILSGKIAVGSLTVKIGG